MCFPFMRVFLYLAGPASDAVYLPVCVLLRRRALFPDAFRSAWQTSRLCAGCFRLLRVLSIPIGTERGNGNRRAGCPTAARPCGVCVQSVQDAGVRYGLCRDGCGFSVLSWAAVQGGAEPHGCGHACLCRREGRYGRAIRMRSALHAFGVYRCRSHGVRENHRPVGQELPAADGGIETSGAPNKVRRLAVAVVYV